MVVPIFTPAQFICHILGDYFLQSRWMANNKTKRSVPAAVHAVVYFLPFLLLRPSIAAAAVMISSHFAIDRWRLARYVAYMKEFLAPSSEWRPWSEHRETGYHNSIPPFLAVWMMIIIDNALHIIINGLALSFL